MNHESEAQKVIKAAFLGAGLGIPVNVTFQEHQRDGEGHLNTLITVFLPGVSPNAKMFSPEVNEKMTEAACRAILNESAVLTEIEGTKVGMLIQLRYNEGLKDLAGVSPTRVMTEATRLFNESMGRGGRGDDSPRR